MNKEILKIAFEAGKNYQYFVDNHPDCKGADNFNDWYEELVNKNEFIHLVSSCSNERADKLEERINLLGKHLGYEPMS